MPRHGIYLQVIGRYHSLFQCAPRNLMLFEARAIETKTDTG